MVSTRRRYQFTADLYHHIRDAGIFRDVNAVRFDNGVITKLSPRAARRARTTSRATSTSASPNGGLWGRTTAWNCSMAR